MRINRFMILTLSAAAMLWAQGPRGPFGAKAPRGASNLDLTKIQTIEGAISAVNIAYGTQYPSIQVGQQLIKVAPVWYLLDNDFELKAGDPVRVTAAPSIIPTDSYLYAITILKTLSGDSITLRDALGIPLWGGGPGPSGNQAAARSGAGCLNLSSVAAVSGTVEKVNAGVGTQMPTLVVKTPDGKLITMKIGPEWVLIAKDFELNPGEPVAAKYAVAASTGENVALELTNAAGVTVVLRTSDGTPAWR